MTVPRAPLIRCSAPGCPVVFRSNLRQKTLCSRACIEAEITRQKLPAGTMLTHPSWQRARRAARPELEPLPCTPKHAEVRARGRAAALRRQIPADQMTPQVRQRMDAILQCVASAPACFRELQQQTDEDGRKLKWACICLRKQGLIHWVNLRWTLTKAGQDHMNQGERR